MSDLHLEHIRREYSSRKLSKSDVPEDPTELLRKWLEEAVTLKVNEPTAMLVATATSTARPSIRTVLLKEVLGEELVFYSNYESRKGVQIHVEGGIRRLSAEESDAYFAQRPYKSRVGARVSPQSRPIPSREYIMAKFVEESLKFIGREVPRPESWGGWAVMPERIEFWQGRDSRLHDRFVYERQTDGSWHVQRIAP